MKLVLKGISRKYGTDLCCHSVQGHFEVIRCTCLKMPLTLKQLGEVAVELKRLKFGTCGLLAVA